MWGGVGGWVGGGGGGERRGKEGVSRSMGSFHASMNNLFSQIVIKYPDIIPR